MKNMYRQFNQNRVVWVIDPLVGLVYGAGGNG